MNNMNEQPFCPLKPALPGLPLPPGAPLNHSLPGDIQKQSAEQTNEQRSHTRSALLQ